MHDTVYLHYQPERDYLLSLMATEHLLPRETPLHLCLQRLCFVPAGRGRLVPNYGAAAAGSNPTGCQKTKQSRRRDVL